MKQADIEYDERFPAWFWGAWVLSGWGGCTIIFGLVTGHLPGVSLSWGYWLLMVLTTIVDGAVAGPFAFLLIPFVLWLR